MNKIISVHSDCKEKNTNCLLELNANGSKSMDIKKVYNFFDVRKSNNSNVVQ